MCVQLKIFCLIGVCVINLIKTLITIVSKLSEDIIQSKSEDLGV